MRDNNLESLKRLQHIVEAINKIQEYSATETMESFYERNLVHDAVLFQFTVIGEAINNIEEKILEPYEYPWYKVRSFRNLIAHEYFNVKLSAVWQIIIYDLPDLKAIIEKIIKNEF